MNNLTENIYQEIATGRNVLLVGPTDNGKTWYVKNTLIPFLLKKKTKVIYFSNPDFIQVSNNRADFFVVDEVETLFDQDFLEAHSTNPGPYYSEEYISKVKIWHNKLKNLIRPSVLVLTRNKQEEIDNIVDNLTVTDWGTKVRCFAFYKDSSA